ncbi:MAG TPA: tRNA uridine-5-carboxymethylaminomethyl(34) synthesis GTPase MnmE [Steroidobacteraceae bacterium]|nr:tRNA uridine-5-carboxymethylaminomethyl(34) synthesis GTPase MnmE [Steroidobacteraceae bacterium]
MTNPDTIVAVASAPGRGAIGVIRVSGPLVPRVAAALLGALPPPRHASLCRFKDGSGQTLDEGLALYFPSPASYTGEDTLELQGHGGPLILDLMVRRLVELGCRPARPGEFSERAFLNGKMDMAQAEAVADLIDAASSAAARAAVRSLQGEFSTRLAALAAEITALRVYVEAAIDFPDEEVDFLSDGALQTRLAAVFCAFDSIAAAARQGVLLREGLHVVIAGPPNAGKSSLLNRLAGDDVAIVADVPGTTRDVLRHELHIDGLPLKIADTAGLRTSDDTVEAEGVRRALREIGRADRVLYVVDASAADDTAATADFGVPVTLVLNKIDLIAAEPRLDESAAPPRVWLSARSGAGVDLLRRHLKSTLGYTDAESGVFTARRRHLDALERARRHVEAAAGALGQRRAFELFAEDLRLAQRALGEITGEFTSEDLLGEIFGSFCIGK